MRASSLGRRLTVEVRLLPEPCLWYWEIRDQSEVLESSWAKDWTAFGSAEEAYRAGQQRLAHLRAA